jgi:anti-anti-sigma factor
VSVVTPVPALGRLLVLKVSDAGRDGVATLCWTDLWHTPAYRASVGRGSVAIWWFRVPARLVSTMSSPREVRVPTDALTVSFLGDPVRVVIVGEIDLDTREQFKAALAQTFGGHGDTMLDLSGVSFMDTHSVTAVVHCASRLFDEGGRLVVYRPPPSLRRIFEMLWGGGGGSRLHIAGERGEA